LHLGVLTPNSKPYTLTPTSSAPNPEPYTLHPAPSTLNRKRRAPRKVVYIAVFASLGAVVAMVGAFAYFRSRRQTKVTAPCLTGFSKCFCPIKLGFRDTQT